MLTRNLSQWIVLLCAIAGPALFAEHTTFYLQLLSETPGLLNGRRTSNLNNPFKHSVVMLLNTTADGKSKRCSAVLVDGCVLTAGHCSQGKISVFAGEDANEEGKIEKIGTIGQKKVLSTVGGGSDLAILKPITPFPKKLSQDRSILAKREFRATPGVGNLMFFGWGNSETREVKNGDGKWERKDFGSGTKRYGYLTFSGYSGENNSVIQVDRRNSSQMLAPGDSGGPAISLGFDGTPTLRGLSTQGKPKILIGETKKDIRAADVAKGSLVSIAANHDWIIKQLDALDCKAEDPRASSLKDFLAKEFPNLKTAKKEWDEAPEWQSGKKLETLRQILVTELKKKGKIEGIWKTLRFQNFIVDPKSKTIEIAWVALVDNNRDEEDRKLRELARKGLSFVARPSGSITIKLD